MKKWEQNTAQMSQVRALKNPLLGSAQGDAVAASEFQVFSLLQGLIDREPATRQGKLRSLPQERASEPPASEQRQQDSDLGLSGARVRGS